MRALLGLALLAGCASAPTEVAILPKNADTTDDLSAVWSTEIAPRDVLYEWARNGEILHDLRDDHVPADRTARGQTWRLTVTAIAPDGLVGQATRVIGNAPPALAPTLSPGLPDRLSGVQLDPGSQDPDGDAIIVSTTWTVAGAELTETGQYLDGSLFARGDAIEATVVGTDGELESVAAVTVVAHNAAATIELAAIAPAFPTRADTLRCETDGWRDADDDSPGFLYSWYVDGIDIDSHGSELDAAVLLPDDEVVCEAIPWDGLEAGEVYISEPVYIINRAPTLAGADIDPPEAFEVTLLSCVGTGFSDADGDPWVDSQYLWFVNGLPMAASGPTLDGANFNRGDLVSCSIAPDDGVSLGSWVDSPPIEVLNTAPVLADARIDPPGDAYEDSVLSCVGIGFSDLDGDPWADSRFEWSVNGVPIAADRSTLDGADFDKGDLVGCRIAADDGLEQGDWVDAAPKDVVNSAPTDVVVTTDPDPVYPHDRVQCSATARDPDGDVVNWTMHWERDGQPFVDTETTEVSGDTIGAYTVGFDEMWRCVATPDDGVDVGAVGDTTFATDPPIGGNVLLIVVDDLGLDHLLTYGLATDAPPTPNIDTLATESVLFENAYTYAVCTPTRAAILTGRYGRRTGAVHPIQFLESTYELPVEEVTAPEMLRESPWFVYANSAIGKWHLGAIAGVSGPLHPNLSGFDDHRGSAGNLPHNVLGGGTGYFFWEKVINGTVTQSEEYASSATTDDTLDRIDLMPEPWFAYVAYNAPHGPFHVPPPELHSYVGLDGESPDHLKYDAMVEALDSEIGRLLDSLAPDLRARTTVIFVGDNGTPTEVITPPFDSTRGKNTPYDGGVQVPMLVSGPLVSQPGTTTTALVHAMDIYATMAHIAGVRMGDMTKLDLAGVPGPITFDSQSLVRWLADPSQPSIRDMLFLEKPTPNYGPDYDQDILIGRDDRWKLITTDQGSKFFDLHSAVLDEGPDLLAAQGYLDADQQEGFDRLMDFTAATKAMMPYEGPPRP